MPFLTNEKNFRKVATQHLADGETLDDFFGAGRRLVALTSQRLLVSNFPFFGAPKLLLEAARGAIEGLDSVQSKSMAMDLVVTAEGKTQRVSLPTAYGDVPGALGRVFDAIRSANPAAAGASYFEDGEAEVASLPTDKGTLKITDRHLFQIASKPNPDGTARIDRKLPLSDVEQFDFYQSKMGSMKVVVTAAGKTSIYGVKATTLAMNDVGEAGVIEGGQWVPAKMAGAFEAAGADARPGYLEAGERLRFSVRAGQGMLGGVNVAGILRLTDRRLLYLTPTKGGPLKLEAVTPLADVTGVKSTKHLGEYGDTLTFELAVKTGDGSTSYMVPVEYEAGYQKLLAALSP